MRTHAPALFRGKSSIRLVLVSVLALLQPGCAIVTARSGGQSQKVAGADPEVLDVPFDARSSRELVPRKRVMVLPFLDSAAATRSPKAAQFARESFVRQMKKTDDFVVVANTDFPKDVATFLRTSPKDSEYDLEAMGKIAGSMGLAAIVEGKILSIRAKRVGDEVGLVREVRAHIEATVQVRVVNAKNGHVIMNETRSADTEEATTRVGERSMSDRFLEEDPKLIEAVITKAFQSSIPRISQSLDKLAWEGRVALIKGDRIYLNAGRLSGLQVGDILKVTEDGEDVYDPETGALIGRVPGRLKGTVEVVSYFGKDGSIGIVHSGSGFKENDLVELY